jgi:hypothetical protein
MRIFDLKDNEITVSPEVLSILVFKDIWDSDKSKNKKNAYNDFKYIYHICDFNSPYNNYSEKKREEAVKEEIIGEKTYTPSEKVLQACRVYRNLKESPIERLFYAVKDKIEDITLYFKDNDFNDETSQTTLKVIDSVSKLVGQYKTLESAVKAEKETTNVKIRGDKKVDGNFNE